MTLSQSRLHHLDRLDLELHEVTAWGRQLEHVSTQVTLQRPSIDPHNVRAPLVKL